MRDRAVGLPRISASSWCRRQELIVFYWVFSVAGYNFKNTSLFNRPPLVMRVVIYELIHELRDFCFAEELCGKFSHYCFLLCIRGRSHSRYVALLILVTAKNLDTGSRQFVSIILITTLQSHFTDQFENFADDRYLSNILQVATCFWPQLLLESFHAVWSHFSSGCSDIVHGIYNVVIFPKWLNLLAPELFF